MREMLNGRTAFLSFAEARMYSCVVLMSLELLRAPAA